MSLNAAGSNLGWRLLPAALAASVTMVAASFVIALIKSGTESPARPAPRVPIPVAADAPEWEMRVFPVGDAKDGLTDAQRARFKSQRGEVKKIVRRVFAAWLLGRTPELAMNRFFAPAAAAEAAKLDLLIEDADAAIEHRSARIGIEGGVPRNAAASIVVRGSTWIDRATLWMHRGDNGWKVIAFEIDRKARA